MTICYFGFYNPNYSRNKILMNGLRQNGITIIECQNNLKGFAKYIDLIKKYHQIKKQKHDAIIVGYPGYQAVILIKFLTKKPIIFDAFTSLYDSMILDRQLANPISLRALYYWLLDWLSCKLADKILLDTNANIEYFVKTLKVKKEKFIRVFVGSDNTIIYPQNNQGKKEFLVHFHGTFIPLQGIEYIIEAAKILEKENIKFNIIGNGQTYNQIIQLTSNLDVKNINFIGVIPYEKLKDYMNNADICLGIFGKTPKFQRVIPNKIYEALAAARPIITAKSPATEELLKDQENVLFCNPADSKDLAEKILELKNNQSLREKIAQNGYQLFQEKLIPKKITADLIIKIKK